MSTPLVSILIPCYNAERWLEATLESALAQTWPRTEIVFVDDGSSDGSPAIAQRFAQRGVRILSQPNAGASAARNRAFNQSRGELIQFLDADDLIAPDKIAAQVSLLAGKPADTLATCAWGRFVGDPSSAQFVDADVFHDFSPVEFLVAGGNTGAMMHPSAWLIPRAVAQRAGRWNEALTLNDDGEYFSRVVLASAGIAFCADPAAKSYYRSSVPGSLSKQRTNRAVSSQFKSTELITTHLLAVNDSPIARRAAANYYQRFVHDFYPAPGELIARAEKRVAELGGSTLGPPMMGPKTALLARLVGWRAVWRLKRGLGR